MKKILIFLLLSVVFVFANVGKITAVKGTVFVERSTGKETPKSGFILKLNDKIVTQGKSKALVLFNDKTSITVGKDSVLSVNEFVMDEAKPENTKAQFGFGKGVFRTITGKIGKINPKGFKIKTKSASIGIRGTTLDTSVKQLPDGSEQVDVAFLKGSGFIQSDATGQTFNVATNQRASMSGGGEAQVEAGALEESNEMDQDSQELESEAQAQGQETVNEEEEQQQEEGQTNEEESTEEEQQQEEEQQNNEEEQQQEEDQQASEEENQEEQQTSEEEQTQEEEQQATEEEQQQNNEEDQQQQEESQDQQQNNEEEQQQQENQQESDQQQTEENQDQQQDQQQQDEQQSEQSGENQEQQQENQQGEGGGEPQQEEGGNQPQQNEGANDQGSSGDEPQSEEPTGSEPNGNPDGNPENNPEGNSNPESEPKNLEEQDPNANPDGEPTPEPEGNPDPEPSPEPNGNPDEGPTPEPEPTPETEPTPEPEPSPEPTPEPDPQPTPEPSPTPEPTPEPIPLPDPVPVPQPEIPDVPEVKPNNVPIVSVDTKSFDSNEDQDTVFKVGASDSDGDQLRFTMSQQSDKGTASIDPSGQVTFTPNTNYNGPVTLVVQVDDGRDTVSITINFTVNPVNDIPISTITDASNQVTSSLTTESGGSASLNYNTSDVDGDTIVTTATAENGTVTIVNGVLTYTPNSGYFGSDTITIVSSDGKGGTITDTISVSASGSIVTVSPSGEISTILSNISKEVLCKDSNCDHYSSYMEYGFITKSKSDLTRESTFFTGSTTPSAVIENYIKNAQTAHYNGGIAAFVDNVSTTAGEINIYMDFGNKKLNYADKVSNIYIENGNWNANINSGNINTYGFNSSDISGTTNTGTITSGKLDGKFFGPNAEASGGSFSLGNSAGSSVTGTFGAKKQ